MRIVSTHRAFALAFLTAVSPCLAADWPQFRGPNSTGVAALGSIPENPKVTWAAELPGRGLASPIVVGQKVFVTCSSGPKQDRLHLVCFDAKTGAKHWERELQATGRTMTHPKTSVAACTPCSDGRRIFALWSSNDLAAFDLEGNLLWLRGLTADYPNVSNSLGMASSPIVIGETVVTMVENDSESYSIGIDAATGKNLWKLERPKSANWTSPLPLQAAADGRTVALLQSSKGITAVDPATGSKLWDYAEGASTMSSSVVADGVIFAASNGITALSPQGNNAPPEQLWRARQINPSTISPLVLDGKVFSFNGAGVIATADAKSGSLGWKLRLSGPFSGSPSGQGTGWWRLAKKGWCRSWTSPGQRGKRSVNSNFRSRMEPRNSCCAHRRSVTDTSSPGQIARSGASAGRPRGKKFTIRNVPVPECMGARCRQRVCILRKDRRGGRWCRPAE